MNGGSRKTSYLNHFASADTIVPDPTNPQAYNRYSYVYNNPIRFNDPDGHEPSDCNQGINYGNCQSTPISTPSSTPSPTSTPVTPGATPTPQPTMTPVPVTTTSRDGLEFIARMEGFSPNMYDNDGGGGGGNCTIGFGHLIHLGPCGGDEYADLEAPFTDGITRDEALDLFAEDIEPMEQAVETAVTEPLNQHQFDALVSFAYNTGPNNFSAWDHVEYINEGEFEEAADVWLSTATVSGGVTVDGLVRRRQFEAELFRDGEYREDW